ncbi:MAG TPA: glycoside hydrolase family 3 N-terminal domain-containing protein [Solirubrobacteraceae bacterium]|nr:glycoside hydrolase family 3 N-terminal domain-containing protein [Solirubrobacteraceae bacterium]
MPRRLLVLLVAALGAALLVAVWGQTAGGDAGAPFPEAKDAPRLTIAQAVGQRMVFPYDGLEPPQELVERIARGEAAGVILFSRNVQSVEQVRSVVDRLQAIERPPGLDAPLLVMVDQEGGAVRRIPGAPEQPAPVQARGGPDGVREAGRAAAATLRAAGVNLNLAPVVDIPRGDSAIARENRAYAREPGPVSELGLAFTEGLREGGVAATAKHYPGLGVSAVNTDNAPSQIGVPLDQLRDVDAAPFEAQIDAGVEVIMMSTAAYPALDPRPAAFSDRWIKVELRDRLGFEGVIITDDLQTPAVARFGAAGQLAYYAMRAGADLPLFAKDYNAAARAAEALERAARDGALARDELDRGALRVLGLRQSLAE